MSEIKKFISQALTILNFTSVDFTVSPPADLNHGDYSTNVALILAKINHRPAKEIAEKIVKQIFNVNWLSRVEVADPGFINFYLSTDFLLENLRAILKQESAYGRGRARQGQKIIIEYTDPNPFKEFHIGHLMSNTIGETIARLIEFQGATIKRACYQGDVGLHVAKAIWGSQKLKIKSVGEIKNWGQAYTFGAEKYEADTIAKQEINGLNRKIYDRSDSAVNQLYDQGRRVSLDYFEMIYQRLGTKFDYYFFESETSGLGKKLVEENIGQIFERNDGAVIFRAEKYDPQLHTRVFLTKENLPTYEAKELGLAKIKFDRFAYDQSIVLTGNEVNDYFAVVLKALTLVFPELAAKTVHLGHGMLRLPSGKMSSRTGTVIAAENLLAEIKTTMSEKIAARNFKPEEGDKITEAVAVAAIKYSILKQALGRDVIFDFAKSLSFEGDAGPYLQYTLIRARAVLNQAVVENISADFKQIPDEITELEHQLFHFPEVAARAARLYAPNLLVTYLTELAATFNHYYATKQIIGPDTGAPYRLALTQAAATVLANGLELLAIPVPERM